jgi:hypothetical protein
MIFFSITSVKILDKKLKKHHPQIQPLGHPGFPKNEDLPLFPKIALQVYYPEQGSVQKQNPGDSRKLP